MKTLALILLTITLNNAALFSHYQYSEKLYSTCYDNLKWEHIEYDEAIYQCMRQDRAYRVVGTILFTEGSYLE